MAGLQVLTEVGASKWSAVSASASFTVWQRNAHVLDLRKLTF